MDPTFAADGGLLGNASMKSYYTQEHKNTPCIRKVSVLFNVILKRWMKLYALRNAVPFIESYTHPILHIWHMCQFSGIQPLNIIKVTGVCACAWVQCFYDSCCTQEHRNTPCVWKVCILMYNLILKMWMKFYALKITAHVIASYSCAILHICHMWQFSGIQVA